MNIYKESKGERRQRRLRYLEYQEQKYEAAEVRKLFRDRGVGKQLVNVMEGDKEYRKQLDMMKDLFIRSNKKIKFL